MEEIGKMLVSPAFWVCTVFVSLLVNFASQWLYPRLGALPGRLGEWRRVRSAKRQRDFSLMVRMLRQHRDLLPLYIAKESRARAETLEFLVLAVLSYVSMFGLLLVGKPNAILVSITGLAGLLMLLLAKVSSVMAGRLEAVLQTAWDENTESILKPTHVLEASSALTAAPPPQ